MTSTSKLWGKTIFCLLILTITTQANTKEQTKKDNTVSNTSSVVLTTYQSMSTEELQKEVEKYSQKGNLSFALGQELIKRWTKS